MKLKWDGFCHIVNDASKHKFLLDMHSHGLEDEIGTELQYVLDVGSEYYGERQTLLYQVAEGILNKQIKLESGNRFTLKEWTGAKFELFKTTDFAGNDIYRVVECDMEGRFPDNPECSEGFNLQYMDVYKL